LGAVATDVLTNVNDTISGGGQLGNGQLTLVNQASGKINATGKNNALTLDTGASGSFSNAGLIESTGVAGLVITSSTGTNTGTIDGLTKSTLTITNSTIINAKGTIAASGASAVVALGDGNTINGATINGGTLATSNGGTIRITFNSNSTVDKATINNASTFTVADNSTLNLGSTVYNTGTFSVASAGNNAVLAIDSNGSAFTGGGTVALTDRTNNSILGAVASDQLTNDDNTIMGAGNLGDSQLTLNNGAAGVIDANATTNAH